ncbi:hypothetical protein [Devosia sp. MC521]|uniref:hypothetical protein n=1 Tax=Devosia sp. MC521 TaxID=2759954 RepID=UPI0015F90AA5|nr:hypothetical protein [Devosia sp. MC521]MBJ6989226.1 hypothetical protein [Devosia sp. MC521]QMW63346.1 hypothetical protein H4N61_03125 [Devosia sp. MC521]
MQVGTTDESFFETLLGHDKSQAISYRSTDDILRRCINVAGGLYGALQPEQWQELARFNCLETADNAVAQMPSYALGWYAKSLFSYQLGQPQAAEAALVQAQHVGRHEQWIAEGRVQLAEDHFTTLSPAALSGHQQDLELLAKSARGVASVARRYATQPDFRERITLIVEQLPPEDQVRFLTNVRRATQTFGMVMP